MSNASYLEYIATKDRRVNLVGKSIDLGDLHPMLFDYQRKIIVDACERGRSALFADTGCGKTLMQVSWAKIMSEGGNALILAPLAVSAQTVIEAQKIGVTVTHCRDTSDVREGINITNYERIDKFDLSQFTALVLDESSILKSQDGKTRTALIERARAVPYRLACTATPAPNDVMELGNHAEFLGISTNAEMLATYFVHDGGETQKWRLKGHAERPFWQWIASWATIMHKPSDLGFSDDGFVLPNLIMHEHIVETHHNQEHTLFAMPVVSLTERRQARQTSLYERASEAAAIVSSGPGPWILWCEYNAEADALKELLPHATEVRGSDSPDKKESALIAFTNGKIPILISKASICGFGMNWQHCHNVVFVGISDSWEQFYQAIRRCWRFGQKHDVNCHLVLSESETTVLENIKRKERDAARMRANMIAEASAVTLPIKQTRIYTNHLIEVPSWLQAA